MNLTARIYIKDAMIAEKACGNGCTKKSLKFNLALGNK